MDASDLIAILSGGAGAVFGYLAWRKAGEANRLSAEANTVAWSSKATAEDANKLATDANWISGDANKLSVEANDIAREATRVVTDDIAYRRQREWDSQRATLHIPDENPIAWFMSKGPFGVLSLDLVNKGAGEIRNLAMTVFDNEFPLEVERGTIGRLTRDDGADVSRLQFLIDFTAEWRDAPQDHLIRAHFDFEDGTGYREEEFCFRFSEAGRPSLFSSKTPCDSTSSHSETP